MFETRASSARIQLSKSNISERIKHIFEEGELSENQVARNFRTAAAHGKSSPKPSLNPLDFEAVKGHALSGGVG